MTLRYLNYADTVAIPTGSAKLSASPPGGQYWIPRLLRVGISYPAFSFFPNNFQQSIATLYHGGFKDTGVDAYVDGTGNGGGDVTALLNGTLIQTGEYLTVDWNILDLGNGHSVPDPTGVGLMQIIGLTADTIEEATLALATAVPGPGFRVPLPNTMQIPQAPSNAVLNIFENPGQNNTVTMIAANPIYVYNVSILTGGTDVNGDGCLIGTGQPTFPGVRFAYYNPGSAGLAVPVSQNFNGLRIDTGGVSWLQTGSAAVNTVAYAVNMSFRLLSL